jgi:hypothetical protein
VDLAAIPVAIFAKLVSDLKPWPIANRTTVHKPAANARSSLKGLAMAESYPERRKHFFDLATAYRNAANMVELRVTDGATRDSDFWSSTRL